MFSSALEKAVVNAVENALSLETCDGSIEEGKLIPAKNVFRGESKFLTKEPFNVAYVVKRYVDNRISGGAGYMFYLLAENMDKLFEYYDGK